MNLVPIKLRTSDDEDIPVSPTKGKLKVTNYGLKKSHTSKRSYKYQKCGKKGMKCP